MDDNLPPQLTYFFATPVWKFRYELAQTQNPSFIRLLKSLEATQKPRSLRNGIKTAPINLREGLWHDLRSFIERSYSQILSEPANYRISTPGANIQGKGGFNTYHVHSNTILACVYYVAVPEGSGMLNIMDPRPQCHFANQYCLFKNSSQIGKAQSIAVSISEGDLLIIPGWLMHSVEPNNSTLERISIPINIIRDKS